MDSEVANVSCSRPKYCWTRVNFESFGSVVRAKRKSTGEVCEY